MSPLPPSRLSDAPSRSSRTHALDARRAAWLRARKALQTLRSPGLRRPDPFKATANVTPRALFSGLVLFPPSYDPSKERGGLGAFSDRLGLFGINLSDLGGGISMENVEREAWDLYVAVQRAVAEEDHDRLHLLCVEPEARRLFADIKVRGGRHAVSVVGRSADVVSRRANAGGVPVFTRGGVGCGASPAGARDWAG